MPTPVARDWKGKTSPNRNTPPLPDAVALLPTPTVQDQASSGASYTKTATHNPGLTLSDATARGLVDWADWQRRRTPTSRRRHHRTRQPLHPKAIMTAPVFTDPACTGQSHLFFAPDTEHPTQARTRINQARALCDTCPHQTACADHATTHNEQGIWGGQTDYQRQQQQPARTWRPPGVHGPQAERFLQAIGYAA